MKYQKQVRRQGILGCLLLVLALLSTVASGAQTWVGYQYHYFEGIGTIAVKGGSFQVDSEGFRHMNVSTAPGASSATNLFDVGEREGSSQVATSMMPGDQRVNYVYIEGPEEDPYEGTNKEGKFSGGLVFLVVRMADDPDQVDSQGVPGYNVDPMGEKLLHEMVINIQGYTVEDGVIQNFSKDNQEEIRNSTGWDLTHPDHQPYNMRVDGCSFHPDAAQSGAVGEEARQKQSYEEMHRDGKYTGQSQPILVGFVGENHSTVLRLILQAPVFIGNEFSQVEGRIFWDFYYLPGTFMKFPVGSPGESETDEPYYLFTAQVLGEETQSLLPSPPQVLILGSENPEGTLPQTGGKTSRFTLFQTVLILVGAVLVCFLIIDLVLAKKIKKQEEK